MILDILNNDAFSMSTMGAAIERMTHKPQGLANMGIFTPDFIRTESVTIEDRDGALSIIKTSPRGAPLDQRRNTKSKLRRYGTVRIAEGDRILASELQFIREFGTEDSVKELQREVARRLGGGDGSNGQGLIDDIDLTLERMRLGAVQGLVLDQDDSVIMDWRTEFDSTVADQISTAFKLDSDDGSLREQCVKLIRKIIKRSKGAWRQNTSLHALCGDNFYDLLIKCPEVRETYRNQEQAYYVKGGDAFNTFEYAGITWENYRGTDDGDTVAVDADKCKLFPVNAPGVFMEIFSPGEKFEHIGQMGQKIYAELVPDRDRDTYIDLDVASYPLHVCTRPLMLSEGTVAPVA